MVEIRRLSSVGRAPRLHRDGRRFESYSLHMKIALVAVVVLAAAAGALYLRPSVESCPDGVHYSYFSTPGVFDDAYAAITSTAVNPRPSGLLVNHHLLAAHLIATVLDRGASDDPLTVVLISPNHFAAGRGMAIASTYGWTTPYGLLPADCGAAGRLAERGVVRIEEGPFEKEHGVSGIVPFIKKSFPHARVLPIIVKDTLSPKERVELANALYEELGPDALMVGSFDFSHETTLSKAETQDVQSLAALRVFEYQTLHEFEDSDVIYVDSIPGLEVMLRYMQKVGATHFELVANTNSALITKRPTATDVTSYIVGYFTKVNN